MNSIADDEDDWDIDEDDWDIQVDTLGFLANNLRGYEPTSILREQLQNADDAAYKQGRRGELRLEFLPNRLVVTNPSVFTSEDWRRLRRPNSRGKVLDADQTGEFGVGFWGALHLTDAPIVTSGGLEVTLDPEGPTKRAVPRLDGTRIEFPYRREPTPLGKRLEASVVTADTEKLMAATFVEQTAELLLFTRAIDAISIDLPDGTRRRATRTTEPITESVRRLHVEIEGDPDERSAYLTVTTEVPDPPAGRHGRITVALPLTERHRGPGRAFFMFPTETESGLNLSIDAHFRATDDRRSLENTGPHGEWNDRIFALAGEAVGRSLEVVLDPEVHRLDREDAVAWFSLAGMRLPDISRRAHLFTDALDGEARARAVIPDRSGTLRRGEDLVDLPAEIERILGDAVPNGALPTRHATTRAVHQRWGLEVWDAHDTAVWLKQCLPSERVPREEAPEFIASSDDALTLLDFCRGEERTLQGAALLLGTDDAYHPIGGSSLARPSDELRHLVTGLARPLVHPSVLGTWAAKFAPITTQHWLRGALIESADRLIGKKVPVSGVGAASKQQHVSEAIAALRGRAHGLDGVPLALDEAGRLNVFDDAIAVGLPDANRKAAARLARRLGLKPLHKAIDDGNVREAGQRFDVALVVEKIAGVDDWGPVGDSRLLVEVLATIATEGATSRALVDRLRDMSIWQGSDGETHRLSDLRLPAPHRITRSSWPLVADELVGDPNPSSAVFATLKGLLRVDILDTTEEVVLACEDPPDRADEQRALLLELGDCDALSRGQQDRLKETAFILCRDGVLRRPSDVLLTTDELPLGLGLRRVNSEAAQDRHVRERLEELGSPVLPSGSDLLDTAVSIAEREIASDQTHDPGRILWEHLVRRYDMYPKGTLGELASVAWLVTTPGPVRRKPRDCYDPGLAFAASLFPVPAGVATPPQALRDALRIRGTLETEDCDRLARHAAQAGERLGGQFFQYINRRCDRGDADKRRIAALRALPIVPLTTGLTRPETLVSRQRAQLWGHLRELVPDEFVTNYPNLVDAWGIATDAEIDWRDHLDVLDELAQRDEIGTNDRLLAAARIGAIAACKLDEHEMETVRRRIHLLTSLGLRRCSAAFRNDLPWAITDRLRGHVPIAEETADISSLLDRLGVPSLRAAVALHPLITGARDDQRWPDVLRRHAANVLRFLKDAGTQLDDRLLQSWPPIVKSVRTLSVRAAISDHVLDEWDAGAHLAEESGDLVLYVRGGGQLTTQAVVDAIAFEFGIDRGRKSLLMLVLDSPTPEAGAERLDWEAIPPLSEHEAEYVFEHEANEVIFGDIDAVTGVGIPSDPLDDTEIATELEEPASADEQDEPSADETPDEVGPAPEDGVAATVKPAEELGSSGDAGWPDEVLRSPRGTTDFDELAAQGFDIRRDLDEEPTEDDYEPPTDPEETPLRDEVRICLSFFDVSHGVLPIEPKQLNWLTSNAPLRSVRIFDQTVPARVVGRYVQIEDGASIFHARQVVPGTVVRVHPSTPGALELEFRADYHRVDGVWMLELDDDGRLERLRQDDIDLQWETDDRFYRSERRLEDIEALMRDGGKSAVQLVIEVFQRRPDQGLTAEQIWDLVAINRLFADATIRQTLSAQRGLFENRDGLWYMVGKELRVARGSTRKPAAERTFSTSRPASASSEAVKVARRLARLLSEVDEDTLRSVVQLLGIRQRLDDQDFKDACNDYISSPSPTVLDALERDLRGDPGRGVLAVDVLEAAETPVIENARPLLDLVCRLGSPVAVSRGQALVARLDSVAGSRDRDPLEVVTHLLDAHEDGTVGAAELWEWISRMWQRRPHGDPLVNASAWFDELARMETIDRRASLASEPTQAAIEARRNEIGWVSAKLPAEAYSEPDVQRLRLIVDLLSGKDPLAVIDGLHELGKLAANISGGDGDASVLYALVCAHARHTGVSALIVDRSSREAERLRGEGPSDTTMRFVRTWTELARIPLADVLEIAGLA